MLQNSEQNLPGEESVGRCRLTRFCPDPAAWVSSLGKLLWLHTSLHSTKAYQGNIAVAQGQEILSFLNWQDK